MSQIIIQVTNKKDETLLLDLAKRLKLVIKKKNKPLKRNGHAAMQVMEKLSKQGGIDIKNPITWQRNNRKDRVIE